MAKGFICFRLRSHGTGRIFDGLKGTVFALFTRNCRTVIFPSKASNNTTRKSMLAISVCTFPLFLQLSKPRIHAATHLWSKKFRRSRCSHLAVQFFDRTDKKFDLDFSVQIFVLLAWFCANRTPNRTNFQPVDRYHVKVASVLQKGRLLGRVTKQLSEDLTGLVRKTMNKQSWQWNVARKQKSCETK